MENSKRNLIIASLLYTFFTAFTSANVANNSANQNERDKARQSALTPASQEYQPSEFGTRQYKISFPPEKPAVISSR